MPDHKLPYNDYGSAMRQRLGTRIQKLALDAGLSCPNRDGSVGFGGCTFCLNEAFSPSYCREGGSLYSQIDHAIAFHTSRRRDANSYIAYLQSGTNTHAPIEHLEKLYRNILSHPKISGLIVGTRPDCISSQKLDILEDISHSKYIAVEYGIESLNDTTLQHVNRGHNAASSLDAVRATKARGLDVGAHLIIGLPHESREQLTDSIALINDLGIDSIKFHQLQIYHNTPIEAEWRQHPERFMFAGNHHTEEYIDLIVNLIRHLSPTISIERMASSAPRHLIAHSPLNGIRPDMVRQLVIERLTALGAQQGDLLGV